MKRPKKDYLRHLNSVNFALADELAQAKPNAAVLAACGLFKAVCDRNLKDYQDFRAMNKKEH